MNNPIEYLPNKLIISVYTNKIYKILEHKSGMSKLINLDTGNIENWNSFNNAHFVCFNGQLKLF